jgi:multidrug efflux pump subunit AcrA (membrane-fusion protein)
MRRYLAILAVVLMVISACGKKKSEAVSIEQLHKENGVPVKVITIEPGSLSQEQLYNATISGAEESTSNAMLADVVTGIHAQIGDRVSKGQLIISFPSNSPQAQNDQARAGFNSARQVYERMQRLHSQGAISQLDLDNARTGIEVAQAN